MESLIAAWSFDVVVVPWLVAAVAFVSIWPVSIARSDASLVDLAWGPGFLLQFAVAYAMSGAVDGRPLVLLCLIGIWSARLGVTLIRRRLTDGHEDPRYTLLRSSWGAGFWWKSLFIVFLLQSFLQWLIIVGPITVLTEPAAALGLAGWIGSLLAVSGLVLETVADLQLDQFKRQNRSGGLLTSGLRSVVRYPHYLGEIVFWTGIACICVEGGAWLGLLSPVLITVFLLKVSGIPLLEEHLSATRPGLASYRARVPALIPSLSAPRAQ
ncbi:MAG: DUF1295 domain-containing protein [Pseudomonadota bacterium]